MFDPRLALASLSGRADAEWAESAAESAGAAFLGGIALDDPTREAARRMVERDREEFLPEDPVAFVDRQLAALDGAAGRTEAGGKTGTGEMAGTGERPGAGGKTRTGGPAVRPGFNVRTASLGPLREAARVCADRGAVLEINAHCRQDEMCRAGTGETLLRDTDRLREQVAAAAGEGAEVSVKVRAEVSGVDLREVARAIAEAGGDAVHVDAMDSEAVVGEVAAVADETGLFVIANNEVRDEASVREYLDYGADAVSVGRPSDDPAVLRRVRAAVDEWFADQRGEIEA